MCEQIRRRLVDLDYHEDEIQELLEAITDEQRRDAQDRELTDKPKETHKHTAATYTDYFTAAMPKIPEVLTKPMDKFWN